jgi:hypothetical protein
VIIFDSVQFSHEKINQINIIIFINLKPKSVQTHKISRKIEIGDQSRLEEKQIRP